MKKENKTPSFRLGITMAGAVSAGAYSAGFTDYLLECLDLWEEKKLLNNKLSREHPGYDHSIPMHDVVIDVVGGASAGGMVSVMTALSMNQKMPHINKPSYLETGNILYDSWVLLDDDLAYYKETNTSGQAKLTLEKMLDTEDLKSDNEGIKSLLNSTPVDNIAEKVFSKLQQKNNYMEKPSYFSDDFRVLVTLCSLQGIPFELNFKHMKSKYFENIPGHRMHEHMLVAHFKTNYNGKKDKDKYLNFDPNNEQSVELIKKCTKGTGAFPIGLRPEHFKNDFTTEYIKTSLKRNLQSENAENANIILKGEFFNFTNVDGGTINNEPYGEVVSVLKKMHGLPDPEAPMFGTIMIDPFPNFADKVPDDESSFQKTIFDIIPKLYTTLRQQVRIKRGDSFFEDIFRLLAFPVKWEKKGKLTDHPPLASGAIDGFGGFFDIEFRIHDFFLGRDNARNFLRHFFSFEYDKEKPHPLFKSLNEEALNRFAKSQKNAKKMMPIIPDMNKVSGSNESPFKYTIPDFPKLNLKLYGKYKKPIMNRIKTMIRKEVKIRIKNKPLQKSLILIFSGFLTRKIYKKLHRAVIKEFEDRKML